MAWGCSDRRAPAGYQEGAPYQRASNPIDSQAQLVVVGKYKLVNCVTDPGLPAIGFFMPRSLPGSRIAPGRDTAPGFFMPGAAGTAEGDRQMKFQPGQSGNPAGRPVGARNRATIVAEELFDDEAEAIVRVAIEKAKAGDMAAVRLCLDRIAAPRRDRPIGFELPPLVTPADAVAAMSSIAAAVAGRELTPTEAGELAVFVAKFANTIEIATFEERLREVEQNQKNRNGGSSMEGSSS
jgi:hypothetical protein